jgi:hypothetical protein
MAKVLAHKLRKAALNRKSTGLCKVDALSRVQNIHDIGGH